MEVLSFSIYPGRTALPGKLLNDRTYPERCSSTAAAAAATISLFNVRHSSPALIMLCDWFRQLHVTKSKRNYGRTGIASVQLLRRLSLRVWDRRLQQHGGRRFVQITLKGKNVKVTPATLYSSLILHRKWRFIVIAVLLSIFTARRSMLARYLLQPCICLSVCVLSQVGVLLKWLNIGSCEQHNTIAQGL